MSNRIGVDGGGTTTRAVVVDAGLQVLGRGRSGSSNFYSIGVGGALANIRAAIDAALAESGVAVGSIESFGFGLAGAVTPHDKARWKEALSEVYGARVAVDEDVAAALAGAFGPGGLDAGGAVLIGGTGANCFGQSASGERRRADGWGPTLGDRGSGYWIGEAALRAATAAHDGAAPHTSLGRVVLEHFEVADWNALVSIVYAPGFGRDRMGSLVPRVLAESEAGDEVAGAILFESGRFLAATARAVLEPLGVNRLALTGGVLENSARVRESLRAHLGEQIELAAPRFEPVVGAALLPVEK